jgi:hypothetical protein
MIDHLSPREVEELAASAAHGDALPAVIGAFLEGTRLRLGWDHAIAEADLGRAARAAAGSAAADDAVADGDAAVPAAEPLAALLARASRWCAMRGLHLMSFAGDEPGGEPLGDRRWFMAVG